MVELEAMRAAYEAVKDLDPETLGRVLNWVADKAGAKVFVTSGTVRAASMGEDANGDDAGLGEGPWKKRGLAWLRRNELDPSRVSKLFHLDGGSIEYMVTDLPGGSRREKAHAAYLLAGLMRWLLFDDEVFDDVEARELCRLVGAYDAPNHAANIRSLKKLVGGNKSSGYKLTGAGRAQAAKVLQDLTNDGGV